MPNSVVLVLVRDGAKPPEYKSNGAAGADLRACLSEVLTIKPGQRAAVPTGLRLELEDGYEGQIRPRSGLALERGISCLNSPGTIDSDYRGEIMVILINHGTESVDISDGDRIAQFVITPVSRAEFRVVDSLADTVRGAEGFGSTGLR